MKATTASLAPAAVLERSAVSVWSELFKARLTSLVVLTTLAGFYLGADGTIDGWRLFHTLLGTALVACGAAALNQWWERDYDARMTRTQNRPLPAGAIRPEAVLWAGITAAMLGVAQLALLVNPLTAGLAAFTLGSYLFIYTPLKRVTTLNTAIGAIPGALPPLMGWTAARGEVTREGLALFAIQFFWQLPHFLAIAWLYREDYARGGFKMLPVVDPTSTRTACHAVSHTLGLLPVSLLPALLGMAGRVYFVGALAVGIAFIWCAFQFARELSRERARHMFFASLLYLPLILGLMALDRIGH
jgi:protoheme IX farnesyltransferase